MFDIVDDGVERGSIALATNGQAAFTYFDAIEVKAYDPNFPIISEKEEEHREYGSCVAPISIS